jgi:hypothetical protein
MADNDKILSQLFKSAPLPEISAGFTTKLMEEIRTLPKPGPLPARPLINPIIIWVGMFAALFITIGSALGKITIQPKITAFLPKINLPDYLVKFSGNYLVVAIAILILLWFFIDYIFTAPNKTDLYNHKNL